MLGDYMSDSGFSAKSVERPWVDNLQGVSCVPPEPLATPIRYLAKWQWSAKHGKNLYHLVGVEGRDEIEMHSANVFEQLLGCIALGEDAAEFAADSLHPGVPSVAMQGVTNSVETMARFEADMRDEDGNQVDFWLTIQ
jgi:hypothetical protein